MSKGVVTVPANNLLRLTNNGVILMILTGQQTKDSIAELVADLAVSIQERHQQQVPAVVLTDLNHMVPSPQAKEASEEALKILALPFDTMAICNSNPNNVQLSKELTRTIQQKHVKSFPTAKEAAHWLAVYMNKYPKLKT